MPDLVGTLHREYLDAGALPTLVDEPLASRLGRDVLQSAMDAIPDDLLLEDGEEAKRRRRAAYVAFLWKRLKRPRPFVP